MAGALVRGDGELAGELFAVAAERCESKSRSGRPFTAQVTAANVTTPTTVRRIRPLRGMDEN
jgi:hypothetical protein